MDIREMIAGDFHEWGDARSGLVRGLSVLGYKNIASYTNGYISHSGQPPQPHYLSKHRIQSLDRVIYNLEEKLRVILECVYILKMSHREIGRSKICDRGTVPKRLNEANWKILNSRYWRA